MEKFELQLWFQFD